MADATYEVEIQDPFGKTIDLVTRPIEIQAHRGLNAPGEASVVLPDIYESDEIMADARLILHRKTDWGPKVPFARTVWFVRRKVENLDDGTLTLSGHDSLGLLARSIVGYTPATPYADKTIEEYQLLFPLETVEQIEARLLADDMMKAYLRENIGSEAIDGNGDPDLARDLSAYIAIDNDQSLAPTTEKAAGFQKLLATLQEIARQSEEKGTPLYFDVVPILNNLFIVKIFAHFLGADRSSASAQPVVFSYETETLAQVSVTEDYTDEVSVAYVGGEDAESGKRYVIVSNPTAIARSPFGRIEEFFNAGSEVGQDSVLAEYGAAMLNARRPRRRIDGAVVESSNNIFGIHFDYGDKVVAAAKQRQFDCLINSVALSYRESVEQLDIRLTGGEYL